MLVIAKSKSNIETPANEIAESLSARSSSRPRFTEEPMLESPRSQSPAPPDTILVPHEVFAVPTPRATSPASQAPMRYPEYDADDVAAHAPFTSPLFEHRGNSSLSSLAPQTSKTHCELKRERECRRDFVLDVTGACTPKAPPSRAFDPTIDVAAVVVVTNSYTFKKSGRKIELVRRVVVQSLKEVVQHRRIKMWAPELLNPLEIDRFNTDNYFASLTPYTDVIRELAINLP